MASVAKYKITRKSLKKPDEFLTVSQKVVAFFIEHSRVSLIVAGCVLVAALAAVILNYERDNKLRQASTAFARAFDLYQQKRYEPAMAAFQRILDARGSGPYRELSLLYKANSQMHLMASASAIKTLEPVLSSPNSFFKALAFKLTGDAQATLGQTNAAAASYRQVAAINGPFMAESLLLQARQLEKSGQSGDAAGLYQKFLQSFPESSERAVAETRLDTIKGQ
jgi:predicted negative regulator of RcsB-dependent stress response